jgi:hypothetical protein
LKDPPKFTQFWIFGLKNILSGSPGSHSRPYICVCPSRDHETGSRHHSRRSEMQR